MDPGKCVSDYIVVGLGYGTRHTRGPEKWGGEAMNQIKWKSELKQLEAEIKEIGQYMESNDLPESVINALDIRLDILMSDVSTLRARIRSRRDYD